MVYKSNNHQGNSEDIKRCLELNENLRLNLNVNFPNPNPKNYNLNKIHTLIVEYPGYGLYKGTPNE